MRSEPLGYPLPLYFSPVQMYLSLTISLPCPVPYSKTLSSLDSGSSPSWESWLNFYPTRVYSPKSIWLLECMLDHIILFFSSLPWLL